MSDAAANEYDLTPRQVEILDLIGRGLSNREIGEVLGISVNTVKVHVSALIAALDVSNRTEAVFIYGELKLAGGSATAERLALLDGGGRPIIAVLPLRVTGSDDVQHMSRALAEDLIARLGAWRWFPVLSYGATADFAAGEVDYAGLVRELGVEYCVHGGIQQLGGRLRASFSLSHAASAKLVWSGQFDGDSDDLLGFIDATARQIVGQMAPELLRRDSELTGSRSFPAWNEASRAMWNIYVGTREHAVIAAQAWERALEIDPNLVYAWYAKAAGLYQRVFEQWSADPAADMAAFVAAAEACVALDLSDSAAHEICGFARLVTGRLDDAIVHLERAVLLNPSNAQAYSELGQALTFKGEIDPGIAALEEALAINPKGDSAWSALGGVAFAYALKGEPEQAVAYARSAVAINPKLATPRCLLAGYLAAAGQIDEARRIRAELLCDVPDFQVRRVTRAFAGVAPELARKFEAAFRAAGFELAARES